MTAELRPHGRLIDNAELLKARLRDAPQEAGVYLMRAADTAVIYVGKAANLQDRLRSYFTGGASLAPRTQRLVDRVHDFEVLLCANEREALILENTLIKRHRPRFNVRLKDDKNYLYLKIPLPGTPDTIAPGTAREATRPKRGASLRDPAQYPRPYYSRRLSRDGARYFGPYTNAQALRQTVRALRTVFPFRTCGDEVFRRGQVCLDFHIKRCTGPCEGRISSADYAELLEQVELFMHGDSRAVEARFREQMAAASEHLDFEQAARLRDRLQAMTKISQRQRMIAAGGANEDVVAISSAAGRAVVAVLAVRQGRAVAIDTHELEGVGDIDDAEALGSFLIQYYGSAPILPRTVMISDAVPDTSGITDFLSMQRGGPVDLRRPQRGRGRELIEQARGTAAAALQQLRIVEDFDGERTTALLADLADRLDLAGPPQRIECYDISNTMGTNSVASMVVFEAGRPKPAHYRHFTIKTVVGADDFASIAETLRRRFARYLGSRDGDADGDLPVDDPDGSNGAQRRPAPRADVDASFGILPDLIIIDGGQGQLHAAHEVLLAAGLDGVAHFGLAKRNEELFRPGSSVPVVLRRDSPTLFLVQRIRDEAHRFAITNHRAKRGKAALRSRLDIVPGLGPVRKRLLLRQFGSVDGIRAATLEQLLEVPGIPRPLALSLKELL